MSPGLCFKRRRWLREASSHLAEIPYQDESGRYADFHALRHTFTTNLAKARVHPKTAQVLARHSTINITMELYTLSMREDELKAISAPRLRPSRVNPCSPVPAMVATVRSAKSTLRMA